MKTQFFILIVLLGAQSYAFAREPDDFKRSSALWYCCGY